MDNFDLKKYLAEGKLLKEDQPTVFDDKRMDALLNIILKYVKDPSDAERELEKFEDEGYDALSPELLANLDRDSEFKAWYKDLHSINEGHGLSLQDVGILRYLLKMIKDDIKIQSPSGRKDAIRVLQFLIDSNIEVDKTKDLSKEKKMDEVVTDKEEEKLGDIEKELNKASKMHKSQADRIEKILKK